MGFEEMKKCNSRTEGKERNARNVRVVVSQKNGNMVIANSKLGWRWEQKANGAGRVHVI